MSISKEPSLLQSFIPILSLIILLALNVTLFGADATGGPNQIALILSGGIGAIIAFRLGHTWTEIEMGMVRSISSAMSAILILLVIGALSGTWLISGIVPAMIYYGLKILTPTFFLVATCITCSVVSVATGSSWSTIATVGIALLAIGKTLGIHEGIIGGAIISGAYFGDKISPLSDTTNLAPAMAGTDLFTHIKYMMLTTVPTIVITLIIFLVWGFTLDSSSSGSEINLVLSTIEDIFNISPILFLVPTLVIIMIIKKIPALPALLTGSLLGGIFAIIFQPSIVNQISGIDGNYAQSSFMALTKAMAMDVAISTDHDMISDLLSSGGMFGMMNTVWLIISAMMFGGVMESCGMLKKIADQIIKFAHSTGSLVASTATTCIFFNLTASDQYMAITVPGRMYAETFKKRGYKPELLSRTLEDSGTVTSVLIPWNTCGATQANVLGVAAMSFAPFCFFCIISPFMTVLHAYLNIKIDHSNDPERPT